MLKILEFAHVTLIFDIKAPKLTKPILPHEFCIWESIAPFSHWSNLEKSKVILALQNSSLHIYRTLSLWKISRPGALLSETR